jgi:hypothetical protein
LKGLDLEWRQFEGIFYVEEFVLGNGICREVWNSLALQINKEKFRVQGTPHTSHQYELVQTPKTCTTPNLNFIN